MIEDLKDVKHALPFHLKGQPNYLYFFPSLYIFSSGITRHNSINGLIILYVQINNQRLNFLVSLVFFAQINPYFAHFHLYQLVISFLIYPSSLGC